MKQIELTHGLQVIVDNTDYERMNQWNWYVMFAENKQKGKQNTPKIIREVGDEKIEFGKELLYYDHEKEYLTFRNHNRFDFRRENLLLVPIELAPYHKASDTNSSSKYKGVYYSKSKKRYVVSITEEGKTVYIGSSKNEEEAAILYNEYAKKLFGDYAFQNIIGEDNRKPVFSKEEHHLLARTSKQSPKLWRGVYEKNGHIYARIKQKTIGRYATKVDAAYAYNQEAIRLFGDKAIVNELPSDFIGNSSLSIPNEYNVFGNTFTSIDEIARFYDIPKGTLNNRIKKMSVEKAVSLGKAKPKLKVAGMSMRKLAEQYQINRHKLSSLIQEGKSVEEAISFLQTKKKNIK